MQHVTASISTSLKELLVPLSAAALQTSESAFYRLFGSAARADVRRFLQHSEALPTTQTTYQIYLLARSLLSPQRSDVRDLVASVSIGRSPKRRVKQLYLLLQQSLIQEMEKR